MRRLTKKGLLQRRRTKDDARTYSVKLTDAGNKLLRMVGPLAEKVDQRILNALRGGKGDFLEQLQALVDKLWRA